PLSGGGRLTLTAPLRFEPTPREPIAVSTQHMTPLPDPTGAPATDVPVTLVVELGRVNLTLGRLADLMPGDVVELGRHSREPLGRAPGGRRGAGGEVVQSDGGRGGRGTQFFL